jgi:Trp operon repressor
LTPSEREALAERQRADAALLRPLHETWKRSLNP